MFKKYFVKLILHEDPLFMQETNAQAQRTIDSQLDFLVILSLLSFLFLKFARFLSQSPNSLKSKLDDKNNATALSTIPFPSLD